MGHVVFWAPVTTLPGHAIFRPLPAQRIARHSHGDTVVNPTTDLVTVIPGRRKTARFRGAAKRRAGNRNHRAGECCTEGAKSRWMGLWVPGSLASLGPRNDADPRERTSESQLG